MNPSQQDYIARFEMYCRQMYRKYVSDSPLAYFDMISCFRLDDSLPHPFSQICKAVAREANDILVEARENSSIQLDVLRSDLMNILTLHPVDG